MKNLVILQNNQAVTTSLKIAEVFEKQHCNILRDIEKILKNLPVERKLNFELSCQNLTIPKGGVKQNKIYLLNRFAFTLLVMGFTGEKAMQFKIAFLDEFERMEAELYGKPSRSQPEELKKELLKSNPVYGQILRYKSMGLSNVEISRLLKVSKSTVRLYLRSMEKMGFIEPPKNLKELRKKAYKMLASPKKDDALKEIECFIKKHVKKKN